MSHEQDDKMVLGGTVFLEILALPPGIKKIRVNKQDPIFRGPLQIFEGKIVVVARHATSREVFDLFPPLIRLYPPHECLSSLFFLRGGCSVRRRSYLSASRVRRIPWTVEMRLWLRL